MTLHADEIEKLSNNNDLWRVVIVDHKGSAPRETGTSMLISKDHIEGTIGGGALEQEVINLVQENLYTRKPVFRVFALGPNLGQCCGGSVSVVIEPAENFVLDPSSTYVTRQISGNATKPMTITHAEANVRNGQEMPDLIYDQGWLFERIAPSKQPLWIYGAGHVGRALVEVLHDLPYDITWVDTHLNRFPDTPMAAPLVAEAPAALVPYAPKEAIHLVLTYSHALDLELCHAILKHPHKALGLIGSATKRARFTSRLRALGHAPAQISDIICPIGEPELGKEPKMIAIGVARQLHQLRTRGLKGMLPHHASA